MGFSRPPRGSYKRNEYQKVILPFTVLKRFDSVLEYSKRMFLKLTISIRTLLRI